MRSFAQRFTKVLAGLSFAAMAAVPFGAQAQAMPDPKDEAKLYEGAKKEGTLVWYVSGPLEPMKATAEAFMKRYPGVKVETLRIVGVAQYQRFMQETQAKRHMVDVIHISDYPSIQSLIKDGHVIEWQPPEANKMPASFRIGNHAFAAYQTDMAIVYNVNKLSAEEIKILESSWKGVLDPRFKGRFAVTTMKCGVCYVGIHMFLDPKFSKEYGVEFLRQVAAQKPTVYSEILVGLDRVIAGEHDFTFWTWESVATTKWMQGAPIRWVRPAPTPEWGNSWQSVSKYAPNPHAARLFQNWSVSTEGALALQQVYGTATTLGGMTDTRKVTKEPWYKPIQQRYDVDFARWDRDYHKDMDTWAKILREAR
jgi:iron(III) transport system substrate-binding protein